MDYDSVPLFSASIRVYLRPINPWLHARANSSRFWQFPFHQVARFFRQPMKAHANAETGVAVNHIAFDYDMLSGQRYSQIEGLSHGNICLRPHIKSADAHVPGAGHTRRFAAAKVNVYQ